MATDWQALAIEKAELISSGIRQLLSSGQGYFRSEFGVELGLTPEIYPSWVILSTAVVGLLVVLVLSWAAFCGRFFGGKKKRVLVTQESDDLLRAQVIKIGKLRLGFREGKLILGSLSGGLKQHENNCLNRAKTRMYLSSVVLCCSSGAWETKVSNREKRQQKRKEKGPDGGVEVPHYPAEQLLPPAPPTSPHSSGSTSWREEHSVNGGGWSDISMKLPVQLSASDVEKWPAIPKIPRHRNPDPSWGQETEGDLLSTVSVLFSDGITAADPSSDWNAPTELWGNYEEPSAVVACVPPPQDSDDPAGGAVKSKKKKKKKKKPEEEGGAAQVTCMMNHLWAVLSHYLFLNTNFTRPLCSWFCLPPQMSSDSSTVTPVETSSLPPPAATRSSGPIASSQSKRLAAIC
uniref:Metadherin a n=1 Tax=Esox lucius TaxID=8010 RepID=A0AAY5K0N2_ESOLU